MLLAAPPFGATTDLAGRRKRGNILSFLHVVSVRALTIQSKPGHAPSHERMGCAGPSLGACSSSRPAGFSSLSGDAPRRSWGRTYLQRGAGQAGRGAQSPGRGRWGQHPCPPPAPAVRPGTSQIPAVSLHCTGLRCRRQTFAAVSPPPPLLFSCPDGEPGAWPGAHVE